MADPNSNGPGDEIPDDYDEDGEIYECGCGLSGTYEEMFGEETGLEESCGGSGYLNCYCGGDLCVCHYHGGCDCPGCMDCYNGDDLDDDSDYYPSEDEDG